MADLTKKQMLMLAAAFLFGILLSSALKHTTEVTLFGKTLQFLKPAWSLLTCLLPLYVFVLFRSKTNLGRGQLMVSLCLRLALLAGPVSYTHLTLPTTPYV